MNQSSKIFFLCSPYPYPAHTGASLRELGISELASRRYNLEYICVLQNGNHGARPLPNHVVHYVQREQQPIFKKLLNPLRPYVVNGYSKKVEKKLQELYVPGAILWISRLAFAQYIPFAKSIGYRTILDEHNIESDFYYSSIFRNKKWLELPLAWQLRYWEKKFCSLADKVVVTSDSDANILKKIGQVKPVLVLPNCIADSMLQKRIPTKEHHPSLLFVGTLDYQPNVEGLKWFIKNIWPILSERKFTLQVAGARPTAEIKKLLEKNKIRLYANAKDLSPIYDLASICIVPLFSGGGTRLKILEAMAYGKAVVSTPKGAEGLLFENQKHIRLAKNANEFVKAILDLAEHPEELDRMISCAKEQLRTQYTWNTKEDLLSEIVDPEKVDKSFIEVLNQSRKAH